MNILRLFLVWSACALTVVYGAYVVASASIQFYRSQFRERMEAKEWCDRAHAAFFDWRRRNPGVYIGLSEEGRTLVFACIHAYIYLTALTNENPYVHLSRLYALLNEFPTPPGKNAPKPATQKPRTGAFAYMSGEQAVRYGITIPLGS